jgi:hypothetical protein
MKNPFKRFFRIGALALAAAVSFISCPEPPENSPIYLSGSVIVSLNGEVKRFSKLTIYSDEGLTKTIGTPLVQNNKGEQGLNDSGWVTLGPYLGDGNWRASIKEKIDTPIEKIWIKVESSAWGSESSNEVIPYSLYLYDKSITGINLGYVALKGTRLKLKIGDNITLNGSPDVTLYTMYVRRGNQFILSPNVLYMPQPDKTYTWDTGVIDDNDDILIQISGSRFNTGTGTSESGRNETTIKGKALKAGYTLDNIALDPYP